MCFCFFQEGLACAIFFPIRQHHHRNGDRTTFLTWWWSSSVNKGLCSIWVACCNGHVGRNTVKLSAHAVTSRLSRTKSRSEGYFNCWLNFGGRINTRAALFSVRNAISGGLSPFSRLLWQVKYHSANELKLCPPGANWNAFGNISTFFFFFLSL